MKLICGDDDDNDDDDYDDSSIFAQAGNSSPLVALAPSGGRVGR